MERQNKFFAVDQIDGEFATLQNDETCEIINALRCDLPIGAKEGSIVFCDAEGKWQLDLEQTEKRAEKIQKMQSELFK